MGYSIRTKLLAAFALNIMLMIALSSVALVLMGQMNTEASSLATDAIPSLDLVGKLSFILAEYHGLQTEHIVTSLANKAHLEAEMQTREGEMDTTFQQFAVFATTADEQARLDILRTNWVTFVQQTHQQLVPASRANDPAAALAAFHASDQIYDIMLTTEQTLVQTQAQDAVATGQAAGAAYDTARILALAISLAALVSAVVIGVIVSGRLARNLRLLTLASTAVATGDLDQSVVVRGHDELATLAATFNHMTGSLQAAHHAVQASQQQVAQRNATLERTLEELQVSVDARDQLNTTVRMLASPVIPVLEGILVMPLIGVIDSLRATQTMETVLHAVQQWQAKVVMLDVTGVPVIDTHVAQTLLRITQAVQLLGAQTILVGLRPELAQTIVGLGLDLSMLVTYANLQEGIHAALRHQKGTCWSEEIRSR